MAIFRTKVGDVYKIALPNDTARYFQFAATDGTCLGGDVVRLFLREYPIDTKPSIDEILNDNVVLWCHTMILRGLKLNVWVKVGHSPNIGEVDKIYFKDYVNYPPIVKCWHVWQINKKWETFTQLPLQYRNAFPTRIFQPMTLYNKVAFGRFYERENIYDGDECEK